MTFPVGPERAGGRAGGRAEEAVPDVAAEADLLAAAALAVPGVAALHAGAHGEAATLLPGRRVAGIQLREDHVVVHVVLDWAAPVRGTALAVQAALTPLARRRVDVTVQDVAAPARLPVSFR